MLHPCEATPNQIIPDFSISRRRVNAALCPAKNVSPETGIEYRGRCPPPLGTTSPHFYWKPMCYFRTARPRLVFILKLTAPPHRHVISDMKYTYIHIYSVVQCRFHSSIVKYVLLDFSIQGLPKPILFSLDFSMCSYLYQFSILFPDALWGSWRDQRSTKRVSKLFGNLTTEKYSQPLCRKKNCPNLV